MDSLVRNSASINEMLTRYGVKFWLYKNGSFHEQWGGARNPDLLSR